MTPKQLWNLALKERPAKVVLFGPPAWLVMESKKGKEDVHATAQRLREELGLER